MRKLASIQKITNIVDIPGADNIVCAKILGWDVVVKRGEFSPGDRCVFFEIDSFLPAGDQRFSFLEKNFVNFGTIRGARIRTIKLKKQISQGLALPISMFPEVAGNDVGDDVSDALKIVKWESPAEIASNSGGNQGVTRVWPSFIPKTDQERVQNLSDAQIAQAQHESFEVTIKLDGSSMSVGCVLADNQHAIDFYVKEEEKAAKKYSWIKKIFERVKSNFVTKQPKNLGIVCSRNVWLDVQADNHFSAYVREHNVLEAISGYCSVVGESLVFQGELVAPSIQGNYEKVDGFKWFVYDVFSVDTGKYLRPLEAWEAANCCGFDYVPVIDTMYRFEADVVSTAKEMASGPGMNPGVMREGLVFKSNESNLSFKSISAEYLLKKEKNV